MILAVHKPSLRAQIGACSWNRAVIGRIANPEPALIADAAGTRDRHKVTTLPIHHGDTAPHKTHDLIVAVRQAHDGVVETRSRDVIERWRPVSIGLIRTHRQRAIADGLAHAVHETLHAGSACGRVDTHLGSHEADVRCSLCKVGGGGPVDAQLRGGQKFGVPVIGNEHVEIHAGGGPTVHHAGHHWISGLWRPVRWSAGRVPRIGREGCTYLIEVRNPRNSVRVVGGAIPKAIGGLASCLSCERGNGTTRARKKSNRRTQAAARGSRAM